MANRKSEPSFGKKPIPVKLDEALLARIDALSEKVGEPRSTVMRMCMRIGLDQLEKVYDEKTRPRLSAYPPPALAETLNDEKKEKPKKLGPMTKPGSIEN
jgi:hypothetical protein